MDYSDLRIRIRPLPDNSCTVLMEGSEGSCALDVRFPFPAERIPSIVAQVAAQMRGTQTSRDLEPAQRARGMSPRELGATLFRTIFTGDALSLLDCTRAVIAHRADAGIRLRMWIDQGKPGTANLASLPWELMSAAADGPPLVISRRTPIVRVLDKVTPNDPLPFAPPLRILLLVSNPDGVLPLDLETERTRILRSWGSMPGVIVDTHVRATLADIKDYLLDHDPHVIHFMGHGTYDASTGEGSLLLERADGTPDAVPAEILTSVMGERSALRLVFLNACKTAASTTTGAHHPFAGVAQALIQAGVTAVLAMQFPISDNSAIVFADAFYKAIVAGLPIDAAVSIGRRDLFGGSSSEWATPVLFLRAADSTLFPPRTRRLASDTDLAPGGHDASTDTFQVFIATTGPDTSAARRDLTRRLAARGISVLGDAPPPYPRLEHATRCRQLMERADLCVHIIGAHPGEPIEDGDGSTTYVMEQVQLGLESAQAQLVLLPEHLTADAVAYPVYREWLARLAARSRTPLRFEVASADRAEFEDITLAMQQRILEARTQDAPDVPIVIQSACIEHLKDDTSHTAMLAAGLLARGIIPELLTLTSTAAAASLTDFESRLAQHGLYVLVCSAASREWVVARLSTALQCVEARQFRTHIAVLLTPDLPAESVPRTSPRVDLLRASDLSADAVGALLQRAVEGRQ